MSQILYFTKKIHSFAGKILYVNLIGMVFISLFEGVGILLLIPFINVSGVASVSSSPSSTFSWISSFFPKSVSLTLILAIYVLLMVGQSFLQRKQMILNVKIQQGFIRHLREETYKILLQANWGFYIQNRKSDIINLMTNEITRVSAGTNIFLQFLTSIVFAVVQLGIAFWLSTKLTLFVLFFGIAILFLLRKFIKKSNTIGKETYELSQLFQAGITDHFNGIKEIKSNMLEQAHFSWFRELNQRIERNIVKLVELNTISQFTYKAVSAFLLALFLFISIKMLNAQPAQLILITMIFSRLWPRFSGIQANLEQLSSLSPSFKALLDMQKQCLGAQEVIGVYENNVKAFSMEQGIECRDVNFRYDPNSFVYALQNINVTIPANSMTAIVGRSGAGKSTLIDLLMGLNRPETGAVLLDGHPLTDENLLSLRKSISYVPQDPFLFNSTIRENLIKVNELASEEQIWKALEFAAACDFVKELPHGLDTLIGDRGVKLSGGERQRLVLARAILRHPSILVLDEATSALDTENESKIQEALEKLRGQMTIIVIAHRLSTIRNADQVIVLEQGEIIQQGPFQQLAAERKGLFRQLLTKQLEVSV